MTKTAATTLHPPKALLLPELLTLIAGHLDAPDLLQCAQVCHAWNRLLIPYLWRTIDDSRFQWPTILQHHDSALPPGGKDKDWIFALFAKFGHHIRHLHTRWKVLLNAAGSAHGCTNLQTFAIYDVTNSRTSDEAAEDARLWTTSPHDNSRSAVNRARAGAIGPLLSPDFEGVFRPAAVRLRSVPQQEQDWITHQRYWLLVRQNPGLRVLRTHWSLFQLSEFHSIGFFYDTLALLPNLRDIDNQIFHVDFNQLLERVPNLQHYTAASMFMGNALLNNTYHSLQTLKMPGRILAETFFGLLNYLPGLNYFCFGCFEGAADLNVSQILTNGPSHLKGLRFLDRRTGDDEQMPMLVLPWLPHLIEYSTVRLTMTAATTLARFCPKLEVFRQGYNGDTTHSEARMITDDNTVGLLLGTCPNLKVIDAPHHRITADYMLRCEWVCQGLESLRCQLIGFSRLDKAEEELYQQVHGADPDLADYSDQHDDHQALLDKALLCKLQHIQVYKQLSLMTQLRILDLGYEARNIYLSTRTTFHRTLRYVHNPVHINAFRNAHLAIQGGDGYIDYGGPHLGTMKLTLNSDLDRLETLSNLEVFGFEGVDHRIGKQELEWMAISWPKLKVMRGLQEDTLPRVLPDKAKSELRAFMCLLRPDVKHEGAVPDLED
ncbi:hypothetical protein BGZ95_001987 [Linnemannia exigua]|uniref:F-box domain-containing protein n=1 Tax=Linnemannia exigua TaxID=604196 RepID=A0AAD4DIV6_9FUNG|nr:hypothetical protein BGZ95_001987 [Linnemannia exigua]